MSSVPIAEFVLARIAEDEADQRRNMPDPIVGEIDFQPGAWHRSDCEQNSINAGDCDCDVPSRVLAQCAALRRVVVGVLAWEQQRPAGMEGAMPATTAVIHHPLRALATIWSDHPDFDAAWWESDHG